MGRRFVGTEEPLAARCSSSESTHVNTRRARTCHRAGTQVLQHQPLLIFHTLPHTFKRLSIRHQVVGGAPFNANRNLRMDIAIERGGLRHAPSSEYRNKAILLDVMHADPQTKVHMRAGSAGRNGSAPHFWGARALPLRSFRTGALRRTQP